ncbi:MAG: rhamnogalacturonan acetylesterase [Mucilaginibacter sp.]|uniref:rhamnogalacturonan acetylesterase n=1 Tax=Mucilaginibacter sp. TaxID=1882438 RepID=UPI0031B517F4
MKFKYPAFLAICLCALGLISFLLAPVHITVYLAGDSTMANKAINTYPETGWGMPFSAFFDTTVTVKNVAKNGQSTKSFIADGSWAYIANNIKSGDYVLIQFGHNDEVPTKRNHTTEEQFAENLNRFTNEIKTKGANPILITPVARRKFEGDHIVGTHDVYSELVRKVAREQHVPLIDLDKESQDLLQKLGPDNSKYLFNYLIPGEHPNYPDGKADDTHFNELGARKMAEIVLNGIKALHLDLADRIVKGQNKPVVNPQVK